MFSRHFAASQPDWPPQTVITGFPFYNSGDPIFAPDSRILQSWTCADRVHIGVVSGQRRGSLYADSLQASTRLNARAVFLTGSHTQGLPDTLPDTAIAWPYAPHEAVFARAAAIVHQGGIGTTAQALASGHPSLVVPFAHDQFDNAERVARLGVGRALYRSKYNPKTAEFVLGKLLGDASVAENAKQMGAKLQSENGADAAANEIDGFLLRRK